jgi:hypothetical protein
MGLLIKLQNGDTALKSLKFGNDRPGGGDSGQPYIKDPILDNPLPESKDFLLRGGLNAPIDAAQDVVRLTKYMFDLKSPSGLLFTAKQNLLSRTAPKTEASKGIGYAGGALNEGVYTPLSTLAQAGVGFAGIHLNKQGIDPTGLIPGLGVNKYNDVVTFDQPSEKNKLVNLSQYSLKNFNGVKGYDLNQGNDVITYGGGPGSVLGVGRTHIRHADQRTGINNPLSSTNKKYFYDGGLTRPNSDNKTPGGGVDYNYLLGVSKKENLTEFETGINNDGNFTTLYSPSLPYSTLSKYNPTGQSLSGSNGYQIGDNLKYQTQQSDTTYKSQIEGKLVTYGRELLSKSIFIVGNTWRATSSGPGGIIQEYSSRNSLIVDKEASAEKNDTKKFEIINRPKTEGYLANLDKNSGVAFIDGTYTYFNNVTSEGYGRGIAGDFRRVTRKKRGFDNENNSYDYITNDNANWDKTVDKIYYSTSDKRTSNKINEGPDLIDFRFEIINPGNPTNNPKPLKFRAYIDNFSDSYNADWKPQTYMGRAEKFYKYGSFDRSISLGFTIVADSSTNLNIMYEQLNLLASSLAPTYTTYGYMAGNLHKLTVGNYVTNQVGIMDGLTYEVMDESPWEITPGRQLPMYIKVTGIKFIPIHDFRPEILWDGNQHQFIKQ